MLVYVKNEDEDSAYYGEWDVVWLQTTELKKTTKKAQRFLRAYEESTWFRLFDAYKKPSWRKQRVYDCCRALVEKYRGYHGRIIFRNCHVFTYAYIVPSLDGEYLLIHSATHRYSIKL